MDRDTQTDRQTHIKTDRQNDKQTDGQARQTRQPRQTRWDKKVQDKTNRQTDKADKTNMTDKTDKTEQIDKKDKTDNNDIEDKNVWRNRFVRYCIFLVFRDASCATWLRMKVGYCWWSCSYWCLELWIIAIRLSGCVLFKYMLMCFMWNSRFS